MGLKVMVQLNDPKGIFICGQSISGKVILDVGDEAKARSVRITFKGFARVRWTERKTTGSGSNRRTRRRTYSAVENYINNIVTLVAPSHGEKDFKLYSGKSEYPFTFLIPMGLPSSYEAKIGQVRYILEAQVDRPWAFDSYGRHAVTLVRLLDLNSKPELCIGSEFTNSKTMCCLCCESDPITATMKVPDRTGFVPGEAIMFNAEIDNQSKRTMTGSFGRLTMQVRYHATQKTRIVNNVLFEVKQGEIEAGGTDIWRNGKLHIPPVPPSYLEGCNIIDIRYYANLRVHPAGIGFPLEVPVEVVIGNIPLRQVAEQHGFDLPVYPPPQQSMGITPTAPPSLPQTTFAESAFGSMSTKEEGDSEHVYGQTEFAPQYAYYNWDKQDYGSMFTAKLDEDEEEN